jgi:hydroxymethylglutaryl-CoA lyase
LIERNPYVSYKVTCINDKALNRVIETKEAGYGPNEISTMISVSEPHNTYNTGMSHEVHWRQISAMIKLALQNNLRVVATLGTVYGCPIAGDVPSEKVYEFVKRYVELGAQFICLGDTTGNGNPYAVKAMFCELKVRHPQTTFVAHFHDTRGTGLANAVAAYEAGVRYFDCALGGIGGQPAGGHRYHMGFSGNVCTEDLASMFEEMGIHTGLDLHKTLENGRRAEEILGEPQRSNLLRCGLVVHKPQDYKAERL